MSAFQTKGVIERLQKALDSSQKVMVASSKSQEILIAAINQEIKMLRDIKDTPDFRAWLEGERFDLTKAMGRK
jgi:hypothetical protein